MGKFTIGDKTFTKPIKYNNHTFNRVILPKRIEHGSYSQFADFLDNLDKIFGGKRTPAPDTDWRDLSHWANSGDLIVTINASHDESFVGTYRITMNGGNGKQSYWFAGGYRNQATKHALIKLTKQNDDGTWSNTNYEIGCTRSDGAGESWWPEAITPETRKDRWVIRDGAGKSEVISSITVPEILVTLVRPVSDWISASSLSSSSISIEGLPLGKRQTLAVGDTTNETRGEGDHTQYNGSKIRSYQYKSIHDYNGTFPMDINPSYIVAAFVSKDIAEIEVTIGYGVGNKDGNYAWWKITSPNGQHKQMKLNIKIVNNNPVYTINNYVLTSGEKHEFDSFQLWNTMGHYYVALTAFGIDMSINVSNTNKNEPCYMYLHEVKYKKYL